MSAPDSIAIPARVWERNRPADERVRGVLKALPDCPAFALPTPHAQVSNALRIILDRVRVQHLAQLTATFCALEGYCYIFPKGWSQAHSATDLYLLGTATEFVVRMHWHDPPGWSQALRAHAVSTNLTSLYAWTEQILHDYRTRHFTLSIWLAGRGLKDILW